jgi:hypothetical protein
VCMVPGSQLRFMHWSPTERRDPGGGSPTWVVGWVCFGCSGWVAHGGSDPPCTDDPPTTPPPECQNCGPRMVGEDGVDLRTIWVTAHGGPAVGGWVWVHCPVRGEWFRPDQDTPDPQPPVSSVNSPSSQQLPPPQLRGSVNWPPPRVFSGPTRSAVYCPILLAGAGLLSAESLEQWTNDPRSVQWWELITVQLTMEGNGATGGDLAGVLFQCVEGRA